jgi:hypothetical protein
MCGIAGYVCNDQYEPALNLVFPLLGVFMQDRGNQSWGYTDGERIIKNTGELQSGFTPQFCGAKQAAIHTRHATKGDITSENSHPWQFGDLIGMHNGVIDNHVELDRRYGRNFPVDSQHIFQHIIEGRDLSEIEGYGAIVFWQDGKVWLGRFNDGDLAVAQTPWGMVYASTQWAITDAFKMAGLPDPTFYNVEQGKLYFIEKGELYKSDVELNFAKRKVKTTWQNYAAALTSTEPTQLDKAFERHNDGLGCNWCASITRELFDTREGPLCGQCARFTGEMLPEEDDDDVFEPTTVREWAQANEIAGLPFDDPCMTDCDECHETLLADDELYVSTSGAEWKLCDLCHTSITSPLVRQ